MEEFSNLLATTLRLEKNKGKKPGGGDDGDPELSRESPETPEEPSPPASAASRPRSANKLNGTMDIDIEAAAPRAPRGLGRTTIPKAFKQVLTLTHTKCHLLQKKSYKRPPKVKLNIKGIALRLLFLIIGQNVHQIVSLSSNAIMPYISCLSFSLWYWYNFFFLFVLYVMF